MKLPQLLVTSSVSSLEPQTIMLAILTILNKAPITTYPPTDSNQYLQTQAQALQTSTIASKNSYLYPLNNTSPILITNLVGNMKEARVASEL